MEETKELSEAFGSKVVQCCFYQEKWFLLFLLRKICLNLVQIYANENFIDDAKSLLEEMDLICKIIDILRLNIKTNI